MTRSLLVALALAAVPVSAHAQDTTAVRVDVSGFIDLYYARDFGRPATKDRSFVTQAVRSDEFNVNLAHIALAAEHPSFRGRLALQAGTSVQANYAGEPAVGAHSGPSLARHLEEATLGVKLAPALWLDGGIYLSYIGAEGWLSTTNLTYTRSYVAEFSPYYLSGARLTWTPSSTLTVQAHVMNGWQVISDNNDAKAVGARIDYAPIAALSVGYAAFLGNEQPAGTPARLRIFQQLMARGAAGPFEWLAQVDYGTQETATETATWWGGVAVAALKLDAATRVSARLERYSDPDGIIVAPPAGRFAVTGASAGVDRRIPGGLVWRSELRAAWTADSLFSKAGVANRSTRNVTAVTSIAAAF